MACQPADPEDFVEKGKHVARATKISPRWVWQSARDWVDYPKNTCAQLECLYVAYQSMDRTHRQKPILVSVSISGNQQVIAGGRDGWTGGVLLCFEKQDLQIDFANMRQYSKYGDPELFRQIQRVDQHFVANAPVGSGLSKERRLKKKGQKKGLRHNSGVANADMWSKTANRRTRPQAANSSTFELRILPCQDAKYEQVGAEMVHMFKMAEKNKISGGQEVQGLQPSTSRSSTAKIRHLQRSLRQPRRFKEVTNTAQAIAAAAPNFDPVKNFHVPALPIDAQSTWRPSRANVEQSPRTMHSRLPSLAAKPPTAPRMHSPTSRARYTQHPPNWSSTPRIGSDPPELVLLPPSASSEIVMSSRSGRIVYNFPTRFRVA